MTRFVMQNTPLSGLTLIQRTQIGDVRGFLSRVFCAAELTDAGWTGPIAQINHTCTVGKGTVRGLHFQLAPHSETKLVSCIRGEVWDVAVDLREGSKTFLQWHAQVLSAQNHRALLIPKGFAHGFQVLSDEAELIYMHSHAYQASSESGVAPLDPRLAITWPLSIHQMSQRDASHPLLSDSFLGVSVQ